MSALKHFIHTEVIPSSKTIDHDWELLRSHLERAVELIVRSIDLKTNLPDNADIEELFSGSTALAFTLMQYLSCLERLQSLPDWQENNQSLWHDLTIGKLTCGLATTHLAKPSGGGIKGLKTNEGYFVTGEAAWVCGYRIFDLVLFGFETESQKIFAFTELKLEPALGKSLLLVEMVCLNGMSTVNLTFKDFFVSQSQIVSAHEKTGPSGPRKTRYLIPQIGLGKRALREIESLVGEPNHPRHVMIQNVLRDVRTRLQEIETERELEPDLDLLKFRADEFNRDVIRLLSIAIGANSLQKDSLAARLQLETMLFDSVIQSPKSLELKVQGLAKAKN